MYKTTESRLKFAVIYSTFRFTSSSSESPQPDGFKNEQCSILKLFSIHNMNNWHDVACAYDKISNFICEKRYFLKEGKLLFHMMLKY